MADFHKQHRETKIINSYEDHLLKKRDISPVLWLAAGLISLQGV